MILVEDLLKEFNKKKNKLLLWSSRLCFEEFYQSILYKKKIKKYRAC